jgi:hypothetical protein
MGTVENDRFIPTAHRKYHGIKLSFLGSVQRVKERTGVIGEILVQKPGRSLAVPRRNKMKNSLRMLGLALCMLPMCLHAEQGRI